jgi:hypothetical protein
MQSTDYVAKQKNSGAVESSKGRRFAPSRHPRQSVSVSAMMMEYRGPLMNTESWNKWKVPRLTPLARWCAPLALLPLTISPAPSFSQGTLEQRLACTPDVLRLCSEFIPNVDEITICLREKNAELSDACRTVFEAAMTQQPSTSDGTQAHKRATK